MASDRLDVPGGGLSPGGGSGGLSAPLSPGGAALGLRTNAVVDPSSDMDRVLLGKTKELQVGKVDIFSNRGSTCEGTSK